MNNELYHHGVKGQKWGVRRYQNKDGTRTVLGKRARRKQLKNDGWDELDKNTFQKRTQYDYTTSTGDKVTGTKKHTINVSDNSSLQTSRLYVQSKNGRSSSDFTESQYQEYAKKLEGLREKSKTMTNEELVEHVSKIMGDVPYSYISERETFSDSGNTFIRNAIALHGATTTRVLDESHMSWTDSPWYSGWYEYKT